MCKPKHQQVTLSMDSNRVSGAAADKSGVETATPVAIHNPPLIDRIPGRAPTREKYTYIFSEDDCSEMVRFHNFPCKS